MLSLAHQHSKSLVQASTNQSSNCSSVNVAEVGIKAPSIYIVSQNQSNEPGSAEVDLHWIGERRACVKRNSDEQTMSRTQSRTHDMSHALEQRCGSGSARRQFLERSVIMLSL